MTHYLIIGANAAGLSAAVRLRKQEKSSKITVLEKCDVVSFGACGIPYYVAGEFTDINQMTARELEDFLKLNIDIKLHHEVIGIDTHQQQVTVNALPYDAPIVFEYDKLLITSGASPIRPPIPGLAESNHITMHSRFDAVQIKSQLNSLEHIAIIGGGFIGVEAAEAFILQGKKVTLLDTNSRILAKTFDKELSAHLEDELRRRGVTLHLDVQIKEVMQAPLGGIIKTDETEIYADLILVATGFKPNTQFLQNTPIQCNERGAIIIDHFGQTSVPNIYAAGDCATVPHRLLGDTYIPLATTANKLGRLVGANMSTRSQAFQGTLGASGIRVFELEAGRVGLSEQEAIEAGINYQTVMIKDKNRTDYVPPQTDIYIKLVYEKSSRILLGGQICGSYQGGAIGRVNALSVAIYSRITVDELGMMDFIYAPPFARTWDALNIAGNVAK